MTFCFGFRVPRATLALTMTRVCVCLIQVLTTEIGGVRGTTRCEACARAVGDPSRATALKPFHECALSEAQAKKIEKRLAQKTLEGDLVAAASASGSGHKLGRPSNRSKSENVVELDAELSDAAFWALVVKSQRRPSEEPSFDRVDVFGGTAADSKAFADAEDDAFINGLIRFPSYGELERDFGGGSMDDVVGRAGSQSRPESSSYSGDMARFERGLLGETTAADEQHERLCRRRENSVSSQDSDAPWNKQKRVAGLKKRSSSRSMSSTTGLGDHIFNAPRVVMKQENVDILLAAPMQEQSDALYKYGVGSKATPTPPTAAPTPNFVAPHVAFAVQARNNTSKLPGGCDREKVLQRYHDKRKVRSFSKTIHYEARKVRAETRVRVGGRFAPSGDRKKAQRVEPAA